jgi:hypothetical protein
MGRSIARLGMAEIGSAGLRRLSRGMREVGGASKPKAVAVAPRTVGVPRTSLSVGMMKVK